MDTLEKLELSAQAACFEPAEEAGVLGGTRSDAVSNCGATPARIRARFGGVVPREAVFGGRTIPIEPAVTPGGRRVLLLKAMLTTACERECRYCCFHAGLGFRRVTFRPEEMARTFMTVHRAGMADGLFLSSGICAGGVLTQDRLIDTAEILRCRLGYRGYLHLKLMPGAERDQVLRAMELADRVSLNLEAPTPERLRSLAPNKVFLSDLVEPLRWVNEIRATRSARHGWRQRWPSSTTQFVVGATEESDLEILGTTAWLMQAAGLGRAYFMAFTPVRGTPLENHPAEDPVREQRLYQASYLLRDYGFDVEDLSFTSQGRLPLGIDPKRAYAEVALADRPVDINMAAREELLKVPGIGPRGAGAILTARRVQRLRDLSQLRGLGVLAERAAPYILMDGRRPDRQMALF